jgi:hypothetical protein
MHKLEGAVVATIVQVVVKKKLLDILRADRHEIWLESEPDNIGAKAIEKQ